MSQHRITAHPILPAVGRARVSFYWHDRPLEAVEGEALASALFASGVRVFGHHPRDGAPQGIFCANGQCAQCLVLADGVPVKACMTPVRAGLHVQPMEGLPVLPPVDHAPRLRPPEQVQVDVLIIGGGPAGLSAAAELGRRKVGVLVVDDKSRLGGKLVLQTHRFFGSTQAVHAGTRGIDIATLLEREVRALESVEVWLESTALAVFSDGQVGVLRQGSRYALVAPRLLLVAAGAREKSLAFRGNTLPGVYGAGAFQTLVNRDRVRAADRLFVVGGGNVGLIAAYHALQAGIEVVGLVEAMPECGGYKVHRDKLSRMGVPICTSHTVLSANGTDQVESVTIAQVDSRFRPVSGTERSFACDTVLIAVGLDPVAEFYDAAREFGMPVLAAGDAEEIAEASAAIFSGRIRGLEAARALGLDVGETPPDWARTAEVLKSRPGKTTQEIVPEEEQGVFPVLHCSQEIPCNPCSTVCPRGLIAVDAADLRSVPRFVGSSQTQPCIGCERCIAVCPGLAVTLVDYRQDREFPTVTIPFEFLGTQVKAGASVEALDTVGQSLGQVEVSSVRVLARNDRTLLLKLRAPRAIAKRIAGIRVQEAWVSEPLPAPLERLTDDLIVCRCERVTAGEIRDLIRKGYRDMNEIKAVTRAGMGACGGKTCTALVERLFREEGVPPEEVTGPVRRPLFVEVSLGLFAGADVEHD